MKDYTKYIAGIVLTFSVASCDDFGDMNVNPNASETPLTSALLTNALSTVGNTTASTLSGLYCQYFSETLYTETSRYATSDISWNGEMAGAIYDLQQIININSDPATAALAALQGSNANQIAVARIVKAYRYSILTDRYGDMPYFEALTGDTQPVFDTQEAIYNDLFKELKEAAAQFDNGDPAKGDILFDGDITAWKRFANSLRLILALRVSGVNAVLGESQFDDVMNNLGSNGGIIGDNAENVDVDYPGAAFKNPWFGIGGDFAVSLTVADYLYNYGDRRADAFGHSGFEGFTYGLPRQDAVDESNNKDWSLILADAYRGEVGVVTILSYADILLARAEAAARGWTGENATALYDAAIQASWEQWDVFDPTAYATYITEDLGSATMLEKIAIQRWITFYPNSPQGYSEWRRTGFPALTPSPAPLNTSGQIPVRYIYPTAEYNLNAEKLNEAVGRLSGGDTQDSRLWWDNN